MHVRSMAQQLESFIEALHRPRVIKLTNISHIDDQTHDSTEK